MLHHSYLGPELLTEKRALLHDLDEDDDGGDGLVVDEAPHVHHRHVVEGALRRDVAAACAVVLHVACDVAVGRPIHHYLHHR